MNAEERGMWREYRETRSADLRNRLVERNLRLVDYVVARVAKGMPKHADRDAMYGDGYVALIAAAERFDPERGVEFSSFAQTCIRGAVIDGRRVFDFVPRLVRQREKDGTGPAARDTVSLSRMRYREIGMTEGDCFVDPKCPDPARVAEASDSFRAILRPLPTDARAALSMAFCGGLTRKEIGKAIGVHESRASQIITRGLRQAAAAIEAPPSRRRKGFAPPSTRKGACPVMSDRGEPYHSAYAASKSLGLAGGTVSGSIHGNTRAAGRRWRKITVAEYEAATLIGQECAA